jgi:hypothetical protein
MPGRTVILPVERFTTTDSKSARFSLYARWQCAHSTTYRVGFRAIAKWQRASPYLNVAKTKGAFAAGDIVSEFATTAADPFPFAMSKILPCAMS